MADYRLTKDPSLVLRTSDGIFVPDIPMMPGWIAYQKWLAAGNTPDPFVPSVAEQRDDSFKTDADRIDLINRLTSATPVQIKNYVDTNVTNLAAAKVLLTKMLLIMATIAKE